MPEISVIVPVYNVECYLRQCIDSVLMQNFRDFELILINDGSTDNCGLICDEYAEKDSRIRVTHQENRGQGYARNVGMDLAGGKYIIFLDSDDYWLPSALEILYTEAERNQTQVLVFGACILCEGKEDPKANCSYRITIENGVVRSGSECLKIMMEANEYHSEPWLRLYRRDYLQKKVLRFDEGIIHEDARFSFLTILFAERVECIDEPLYQYRQWSGSTTHSKSLRTSARGLRVCLDGLLDVYFSHSCSLEEAELLERYCVLRAIYIRDIYYYALRKRAWKIARWIQRDSCHTLKKLRKIPNLSFHIRMNTYSLFLSAISCKIYSLLRRLVAGKS